MLRPKEKRKQLYIRRIFWAMSKTAHIYVGREDLEITF